MDPPPMIPEQTDGPPSPCIDVCALGTDGLCTGCLRSGDEIARWSTMKGYERREVIAAVARRRQLRLGDKV